MTTEGGTIHQSHSTGRIGMAPVLVSANVGFRNSLIYPCMWRSASSLAGAGAMANSPRPWQRGGSDAAAGVHRRAASAPSEPAAAPPRGIDTSVFDPAFVRIAEAAPIVMVLGGAGTGKTVF